MYPRILGQSDRDARCTSSDMLGIVAIPVPILSIGANCTNSVSTRASIVIAALAMAPVVVSCYQVLVGVVVMVLVVIISVIAQRVVVEEG